VDATAVSNLALQPNFEWQGHVLGYVHLKWTRCPYIDRGTQARPHSLGVDRRTGLFTRLLLRDLSHKGSSIIIHGPEMAGIAMARARVEMRRAAVVCASSNVERGAMRTQSRF